MKISHEDYLKRTLSTKRMVLDNLGIEHRISIAKFDTMRNSLKSEIDSIEKQLEE